MNREKAKIFRKLKELSEKKQKYEKEIAGIEIHKETLKEELKKLEAENG